MPGPHRESLNPRESSPAGAKIDSVMEAVAKWLLQISWIDLAVGTAAGLAAAGLLAIMAFYLRWRAATGGGIERDVPDERQRLLLFCGDVKALTDLAIQRHMSDAVFYRRFQEQPSYEILFPHFSERFREHLVRPRRPDGHSDLAAACREECDRLEQQWMTR